MASNFDLAAITLSDPVNGAKGAKIAPVSYLGKPIVWMPDAQVVAYEPSAFQNEEASRVNLVMRASQEAVESLTAFDEHIIALCTEHSANLFGKTLTLEEVKLRYTPCLKQSSKGYEPTFKTKINLSGRGQVKYWDSQSMPCKAPESWIGYSIKPRVVVKCLWLMPKEFGCLFECTDVLINEACPETFVCPF